VFSDWGIIEGRSEEARTRSEGEAWQGLATADGLGLLGDI